MGLSRFGNLKLGKEGEKPIYSDITWFSLLFCSGIGIGEHAHTKISFCYVGQRGRTVDGIIH
jgi:hypothetical protein